MKHTWARIYHIQWAIVLIVYINTNDLAVNVEVKWNMGYTGLKNMSLW